MGRPSVSPELAAIISRLGQIRRQVKDLETEDSALRDAVLKAIVAWPQEWFPMRVAGYTLSRQERSGRLDPDAAWDCLQNLGLGTLVPQGPALANEDAALRFPDRLAGLGLSPGQVAMVLEAYGAVIQMVPQPSPELIRRWLDEGRLTEHDYRQCFKDGRPTITVLTVR